MSGVPAARLGDKTQLGEAIMAPLNQAMSSVQAVITSLEGGINGALGAMQGSKLAGDGTSGPGGTMDPPPPAKQTLDGEDTGVVIEGVPAAVVSDGAPGEPSEGAPHVMVKGKPLAREGDGTWAGTAISDGADAVFVGEHDGGGGKPRKLDKFLAKVDNATVAIGQVLAEADETLAVFGDILIGGLDDALVIVDGAATTVEQGADAVVDVVDAGATAAEDIVDKADEVVGAGADVAIAIADFPNEILGAIFGDLLASPSP